MSLTNEERAEIERRAAIADARDYSSCPDSGVVMGFRKGAEALAAMREIKPVSESLAQVGFDLGGPDFTVVTATKADGSKAHYRLVPFNHHVPEIYQPKPAVADEYDFYWPAIICDDAENYGLTIRLYTRAEAASLKPGDVIGVVIGGINAKFVRLADELTPVRLPAKREDKE